MKIENIREVKARLNRLVGDLPKSGSIIVTRNGTPCAVLMPITEDTDIEAIALTQNRAFWTMYDAAIREAEETGWSKLGSRPERSRRAAPSKRKARRQRSQER
jgi:antitoxin (DNA-binding transcriptional repressor) of toxin-antitoxin stability system